MAKLHLIFDPDDKIIMDPGAAKQLNVRLAIMSVPQDVNTVDIYNLAKRLAEMLLETL